MQDKEFDYLQVLRAVDEIPFGVGKKLLIEFLQGKAKTESIIRNKLNKKQTFGSLAYEDNELSLMIDKLLLNNLLEIQSLQANKFWKIIGLTEKGRKELQNPTLHKKKLSNNFKNIKTVITEKERELFLALGDFISKYNDEQKKAIISNKEHILCLAGAGTGKTSVLTKRIEFLVQYKSVQPQKILAITFTRKTRDEMVKRLSQNPQCNNVQIETFNSFCERMLRTHNNYLYDKPMEVIMYRDKIKIIMQALNNLHLDINKAIAIYFTSNQQRGKSSEQLANIFMHDCFFVRDYFKSKNKQLKHEEFETDEAKHEQAAAMMYGVCNYIDTYMQKYGLRDFTDQLLDTLKLFTLHKELIPKFDHIMIDEYQDINTTQIELINDLNPPNLFSVGDPRQSIYGWRGSDIKFILNFEDAYPNAEIITLTKNYRSSPAIVDLINKAIAPMGLADLESAQAGNTRNPEIKMLKCQDENAEFSFVINNIKNTTLPRNEIFVLARTNRQLKDLSDLLKLQDIAHVVRTDETRKRVYTEPHQITLATIHAIKGLEAEMVLIIGCTAANFPCRASDHPVIDMIKVDEYDKEEEERRLFYVAMSRAKQNLFLTYTGKNPTYYITPEMLKIVQLDKTIVSNLKLDSEMPSISINTAKNRIRKTNASQIEERLKQWRWEIAQQHSIPAYMVVSNKTIIELAQKMPLTTQEMYDIYGLGPNKIMRYGEELLKVLHR
ncbi:UvrD-helicase domain-containing protein [Candidatus Woesearchaeota archaeon]|nr:UvrD-helicase domain-containing protein [Candidatus Woesearchaeota archaeon]